MGKAYVGPRIRIGDFRAGAGLWQLPECVYLSPAAGFVGDSSRFGLPQVRAANPLLRQCSGPELADLARTLPPLQGYDLAALSGGRVADWLRLFLACYAYFGLTLATLKYCTFGFLLVGLIFTDAETQLLPDKLTLAGICPGIALQPGGSG